jgi:hypothetical protein
VKGAITLKCHQPLELFGLVELFGLRLSCQCLDVDNRSKRRHTALFSWKALELRVQISFGHLKFGCADFDTANRCHNWIIRLLRKL